MPTRRALLGLSSLALLPVPRHAVQAATADQLFADGLALLDSLHGYETSGFLTADERARLHVVASALLVDFGVRLSTNELYRG